MERLKLVEAKKLLGVMGRSGRSPNAARVPFYTQPMTRSACFWDHPAAVA